MAQKESTRRRLYTVEEVKTVSVRARSAEEAREHFRLNWGYELSKRVAAVRATSA